MIPLPFAYAEIHYRLPWLAPAYYRSMPEIVTDLPTRYVVRSGRGLPVVMIVKDAHKFPVTIHRVTACILQSGKTERINFEIEQAFDAPYRSVMLYINSKRLRVDRMAYVSMRIECTIDGNEHTFFNDNYPGLNWAPYRCFISSEPLPYPDGWHAGDPHVHTNFTDDQVEFGADIQTTREMAKAMGLDWFFVTDHSYDLDDREGDCLRNDPALPKWNRMKAEVQRFDSPECRIVHGEEASIGNMYGENVHLLAVNRDGFIYGSGDSAERWLENKPQQLLSNLKSEANELLIAAHPFERVPILQRLLIRRGNWQLYDFDAAGIRHLQCINSATRSDIIESILHWRDMLLTGRRFYLLAGNDSHGNFNIMRQIRVPFLKLFSSRKQTFGKMTTVFRLESNDPVEGIRAGEMIVTNGPFIKFQMGKGENAVHIGQTMKARRERLFFEVITSKEFGRVTRVDLLIGDVNRGKERRIINPDNRKKIAPPNHGYLRMELRTRNGGFAATNPIWIES